MEFGAWSGHWWKIRFRRQHKAVDGTIQQALRGLRAGCELGQQKFHDGGDHACHCLCSLLPSPPLQTSVTEDWKVNMLKKKAVILSSRNLYYKRPFRSKHSFKSRTKKLQDQFGVQDCLEHELVSACLSLTEPALLGGPS